MARTPAPMATGSLAAARRFAALAVGACCLLFAGCYFTRNVWRPDHAGGYDLPTLRNAPATDHLLVDEGALAIDLVVDTTTLTPEQRRAMPPAVRAGAPVPYRFACAGALAKWAVGTALTRDVFSAPTARLRIDAGRAISSARLTFDVRLREPTAWRTASVPTGLLMDLPQRPAEPLGRGLDALALLITGGPPAWRAPHDGRTRLVFLGWLRADGSPAKPFSDLEAQVDELVAHHRLASLPDLRLACRLERDTLAGGVANEGLLAVPLMDLVVLGLLDQAGEDDWIGTDPAAAPAADALTVRGVEVHWVEVLMKIRLPTYLVQRTIERVIMTPGCLVVDGLCWTFAACTFPIWAPFDGDFNHGGGGGGGLGGQQMSGSFPVHLR